MWHVCLKPSTTPLICHIHQYSSLFQIRATVITLVWAVLLTLQAAECSMAIIVIHLTQTGSFSNMEHVCILLWNWDWDEQPLFAFCVVLQNTSLSDQLPLQCSIHRVGPTMHLTQCCPSNDARHDKCNSLSACLLARMPSLSNHLPCTCKQLLLDVAWQWMSHCRHSSLVQTLISMSLMNRETMICICTNWPIVLNYTEHLLIKRTFDINSFNWLRFVQMEHQAKSTHVEHGTRRRLSCPFFPKVPSLWESYWRIPKECRHSTRSMFPITKCMNTNGYS